MVLTLIFKLNLALIYKNVNYILSSLIFILQHLYYCLLNFVLEFLTVHPVLNVLHGSLCDVVHGLFSEESLV